MKSVIDSSSILSERLLATKLYIPARHAGVVERGRLMARLQEGLWRPLTLVCAPAGSGKTTLLSEWLATCDEMAFRGAWVSLDLDDNDPVRFWHYLAAALGVALDETIFDGLSTAPTSPGVFLTPLINALSATTISYALILDDYHCIHESAIHDGLVFLLEHLPHNVHLFIASRVEPPLPLARLRMRQQVLELSVTDLRFTVEEATLFLQQALGTALASEDVAALEARTEGWIAGLQLAALSMRGRTDLSAFIAAFRGSHRYIVDYLAEEVLQRLPELMQSFLLSTSLLSQLSASLCNALTERADGQEMLEQLEQANIFLVPLDDERCWYRYHHLFAEILQHRLHRLHSALVPELHRRASRWYEAREQLEEAIEHALAAHEFERVADLVERKGGSEMLRWGGMKQLVRWLEALPGELLQAHPTLSLFMVWGLFSTGRGDEVERHLQAIERVLHEPGERIALKDPARFALNIRAAYAALAYAQGDARRSIELFQPLIASIAPDNYMRLSYCLFNLALARWQNGEIALADQLLAETYQVSIRAGHIYIALSSWHFRAFLQTLQGHLQQVSEHLLLARMLLQRGRVEEALELLERYEQEAETSELTGMLIKILVLQVVALHSHGDKSLALATLTRALTLAEASGYMRTFLDEGEQMISLLSTLLITPQDRLASATAVPTQYIQRLLSLSGAMPPDRSSPQEVLSDEEMAPLPHENGSQALPSQLATGEPLSVRELEILHLIAAGLSNQQITERLVIAMSTLKTHINHLYAKLAVRSRTQAIVQAQALKLL